VISIINLLNMGLLYAGNEENGIVKKVRKCEG
jgi:hypothetical protein